MSAPGESSAANRRAPSLKEIILPYMEIEGMAAAALVSNDGLLVAWAGDRRLDPEAIAANAASVLSSVQALASALGTGLPGLIDLGLPGNDLMLAPLTGDLTLVLVGRDDAIRSLARRGSVIR